MCVVVSLVTGLIIEFGYKAFKKIIEEIHELGIYYLVGFFVLHWLGVLIAEFTNQKGIVSRIVSGSKN
nr:cytochrome b/b6 domain-containing protein [Psychroflexus torquis]